MVLLNSTDSEILTAVERFTNDEHDVRHLPVINEDGTLTGIVTLNDLVATISEQPDNVADTIEVPLPDYNPNTMG